MKGTSVRRRLTVLTLTGGADADFFSGGSGTDTATDFNAVEGDTKDTTT